MKIIVTFGGFSESFSPGLLITYGFQYLLGSLGIIPEVRCLGELFFFCNKGKFFINVKETSSKHPVLPGCSLNFPV